MRDCKTVETELLRDPETKAGFEALRPYFESVSQIIQVHTEQGLMQSQHKPVYSVAYKPVGK